MKSSSHPESTPFNVADATDRYARALVDHALEIREGRLLYIRCTLDHRDLALRVGDHAYARGAYVHYRLVDTEQMAQLIRHGSMAAVRHDLEGEKEWHSEILRQGGAAVRLTDCVVPDVFKELSQTAPETYQLFTRGKVRIMQEFQTEADNTGASTVTVATSPSKSWARKLFPKETPRIALERLWRLILSFAHVDDDGRGIEEHTRRLDARAKALDDLEIEELHITGGGNDCRLGLVKKARWCCVRQKTPAGQTFMANFPSEEVFTTPHRLMAEGRLVASIPFKAMDTTEVRDLVVELRNGRAVEIDASSGLEELVQWLAADEGARRLGEIGLVDQSSPIARSKLYFGHGILDENAASHFAFGQAYVSSVEGAGQMSEDQLRTAGCNQSSTHLDVMFGSPEVDVVAVRTRKGRIPLMENGSWVVG